MIRMSDPETRVPLHMGDWILYKDTGSLFHKKCKKFHNTMWNNHRCGAYNSVTILSPMIITMVNICRETLRLQTWTGCQLPYIAEEKCI